MRWAGSLMDQNPSLYLGHVRCRRRPVLLPMVQPMSSLGEEGSETGRRLVPRTEDRHRRTGHPHFGGPQQHVGSPVCNMTSRVRSRPRACAPTCRPPLVTVDYTKSGTAAGRRRRLCLDAPSRCQAHEAGRRWRSKCPGRPSAPEGKPAPAFTHQADSGRRSPFHWPIRRGPS